MVRSRPSLPSHSGLASYVILPNVASSFAASSTDIARERSTNLPPSHTCHAATFVPRSYVIFVEEYWLHVPPLSAGAPSQACPSSTRITDASIASGSSSPSPHPAVVAATRTKPATSDRRS